MKNQSILSFDGRDIVAHNYQHEAWITSADIGRALDYQDVGKIGALYRRHADEFDESMTCTAKLAMQGQMRQVRIFNKDGAYLIAMLAKTPKGAAFRKWVLKNLKRDRGPNHQGLDTEKARAFFDAMTRAGLPTLPAPHGITEADRLRGSLISSLRRNVRLQGQVIRMQKQMLRGLPLAAMPAVRNQPDLFGGAQ